MEIGKKHLFALAFAAATGTPYLVSMTTKGTGGGPATDVATVGSVAEADRALADGSPIALEGAPVKHLGEVFRFDIDPRWIMGRWARVATVTPEADLRGYRVPLVTGTAEHDLAGSLTYYFDPQQRVRRIVFIGTTGDARPLAAFVVRRHHFQRKIAPDPGLHLYQVVRDGKAQSELRIRPTPVVQAFEPHARYSVELWLERPSDFRMFSQAKTPSTTRLGP
jgi:hypothetical protein